MLSVNRNLTQRREMLHSFNNIYIIHQIIRLAWQKKVKICFWDNYILLHLAAKLSGQSKR